LPWLVPTLAPQLWSPPGPDPPALLVSDAPALASAWIDPWMDALPYTARITALPPPLDVTVSVLPALSVRPRNAKMSTFGPPV
jgi:hypothetical protein